MEFRVFRLKEYREKLQDARFSGIQSFTDQNGERVVYRSQAEIELAIAALDIELAALQNALQNTRKPSILYLSTSKGI